MDWGWNQRGVREGVEKRKMKLWQGCKSNKNTYFEKGLTVNWTILSACILYLLLCMVYFP